MSSICLFPLSPRLLRHAGYGNLDELAEASGLKDIVVKKIAAQAGIPGGVDCYRIGELGRLLDALSAEPRELLDWSPSEQRRIRQQMRETYRAEGRE